MYRSLVQALGERGGVAAEKNDCCHAHLQNTHAEPRHGSAVTSIASIMRSTFILRNIHIDNEHMHYWPVCCGQNMVRRNRQTQVERMHT